MAVRRTKVSAPVEDSVQDSVPQEPKSARAPRMTGGSGWGAPKSPRRETVSAPYLDVKEAKVIKGKLTGGAEKRAVKALSPTKSQVEKLKVSGKEAKKHMKRSTRRGRRQLPSSGGLFKQHRK